MKMKFCSVSQAVLAATVLTFISTVQAGTWTGPRALDSVSGAHSNATANSAAVIAPRANRHGADDPANHDINDNRGGNRGGNNQPGDDRGRGRGRHRGPGR